jgi:hypothetical protein
MKGLILITLASLLTATTIIAQKNEAMTVYTFQEYKSEHSDPDKNKTTVLVSGTQGDEVLRVKMVTSTRGILELYLNDKTVAYDAIGDYKILTDYIADYAEMPRPEVAEEAIPKEEAPKEVKYNEPVNGAIIAEMRKDELITEDTDVYDIVIAYNKMYFNGKEQSEEMSKRYKTLYESISGIILTPTTYYHLSQSL